MRAISAFLLVLGISGQYNFDLKFAPLSTREDDPLTNIFAVLQDRLGLRLEAIKVW